MTMPQLGGKALFGDSNIARTIAPVVVLANTLQEAIDQKVGFEDEFFVSGLRVNVYVTPPNQHQRYNGIRGALPGAPIASLSPSSPKAQARSEVLGG